MRRFSLRTPGATLAELFRLAEPPAWIPRYNIALTQPAPTVLMLPEQHSRQAATATQSYTVSSTDKASTSLISDWLVCKLGLLENIIKVLN